MAGQGQAGAAGWPRHCCRSHQGTAVAYCHSCRQGGHFGNSSPPMPRTPHTSPCPPLARYLPWTSLRLTSTVITFIITPSDIVIIVIAAIAIADPPPTLRLPDGSLVIPAAPLPPWSLDANLLLLRTSEGKCNKEGNGNGKEGGKQQRGPWQWQQGWWVSNSNKSDGGGDNCGGGQR
jgi:hypothetical protein